MRISNEKLAIVIPTFRRTSILRCLLLDLLCQTVLPDVLVIVDGDPVSAEVRSMLMQYQFPSDLIVKYISSNHGNAPYQRFLGAEVTSECHWLVFIDDDIRITQQDAIEKLISPFAWNHRYIVGVTPNISFPSREIPVGIRSRRKYLELMRSSFRLSPGELTPSGDRIPIVKTDNDYDSVQWLRGGVMAYRRSVLCKVIFSEDVFALSHIQCGLGADDTYLSRCVGLDGELLIASCVTVVHPDADASKAYPADMYRLAYARAYSRRFLNDHYRLKELPQFSDRLALVKNYVWNFISNWGRAIAARRMDRLSYAWGYTIGLFRGLFQKPIARNLTPDIDWRADAEQALANQVLIK